MTGSILISERTANDRAHPKPPRHPSRPSAGVGTESHGRMDHPKETLRHQG
jgi:hypothetical protein